MTPINKDHVIQVAQVLLTYLDDPNNSTPNDMLEGIVSAKSLMRGLVGGNLVVCQPGPAVKEGGMSQELKAAAAAKEAEEAEEDPKSLGELLKEDEEAAAAVANEEEAA